MADITALLGQLISLIEGLGSMSPQAKIAAIVLFITAVWKSSFLQPYYAALGNAANLVGPVLGLISGVLAIQPLSWGAVWTGVYGGSLAVLVVALLEAVKSIPGIGSLYVSLINWVEGLLGSPAPEPAPVSLVAKWKNRKSLPALKDAWANRGAKKAA
jgi:hypothetical protein